MSYKEKNPLPPNAPSWCQAPFDPERVLSFMIVVVTCLIWLQFGRVIVHLKDHREKIVHWTGPSLGLLKLGFVLDFFGIKRVQMS
ncbi:hypothetical protein J5N97_028527 [Dioscorea zingiberensis]|uniref:Uncharacterized protein n=1 Tax=Dioscorea zingiberensis TaxID=325984 RepID=A0A9D5H4Y0_9LILI|nr:hypothetical protein J5N97_028527 [Dioscorea zingiberensis]